MSVPFHSLHLNSQTREWSFHSLLLKLPNKGKERIFLKYSLFFFFFFSFHSISFPPPKQSVTIIFLLNTKAHLFRCKKFSNVKCFQIQIISRKMVYFLEFDCILKNVQENIKKKNHRPQILNNNPAATTSSTSQSNPLPTQTTTILQANHNQKPTTTTANPTHNQQNKKTN